MKAVKLPTDGQLWYRNVFLKSDEWTTTSKEIREKAGRCNLCGTNKSTLVVHHIYYSKVDMCDPAYLICLCRECHAATHKMIKDFQNLPVKVVMHYNECVDFAKKAAMNYYVMSYLRHDDSKTFFDLDNLKNLRYFIGVQLRALRPDLTIYNNCSLWEEKGFPLAVGTESIKDAVKEYVAYHLWHIRYAYPNTSVEQLRKHFKLGKTGMKHVLMLENNIKERYKNMKAIDLTNVQATQGGEFARPTAGGYVIGIVSVEDVPEKEYLKISYDIAEGEFKNYYYDMKQRTDYDLPVMYKSYKDKALGFFKAFLDAVAASNPGYTWNNDERTLTRKLVGCVLREEEYRNRDGEIKVSLKPEVFYSAADIRAGKFEVLDRKCLNDARYDKYVDSKINTSSAAAPAAMPATTPAQDAFADMEIFGDDGVPF